MKEIEQFDLVDTSPRSDPIKSEVAEACQTLSAELKTKWSIYMKSPSKVLKPLDAPTEGAEQYSEKIFLKILTERFDRPVTGRKVRMNSKYLTLKRRNGNRTTIKRDKIVSMDACNYQPDEVI